MRPLSPTLFDRLTSRIAERESGCSEYTGYICRHTGYGKISNSPGPPIGTHVASWLLNRGEIPDGFCIRHKCDNRKCIKIEHLEIGAPLENTRDMIERGRFDNYKERIDKCPDMHPYDIVDQDGYRACSVCRNRTARRLSATRRSVSGITDLSLYCHDCWFRASNCKCDEIEAIKIPGIRYEYKEQN